MKKSTDADLGRWRVFHDRPGWAGRRRTSCSLSRLRPGFEGSTLSRCLKNVPEK